MTVILRIYARLGLQTIDSVDFYLSELSGVLCLGWLKKRVAKQLCLGMLGDNLGHLESSFIYPDGVVHVWT